MDAEEVDVDIYAKGGWLRDVLVRKGDGKKWLVKAFQVPPPEWCWESSKAPRPLLQIAPKTPSDDKRPLCQ